MLNRHQISNRRATFAGLAVLTVLMAVPDAFAMPEGPGRAAPAPDVTPVTAKCATSVTVVVVTKSRAHAALEVAPRFFSVRRSVTACGPRLAGR